jgi:hypothetical protein
VDVQSTHAAPVNPHAVFAVPATQVLPWQHPMTQFCALHVLLVVSGAVVPESTGPASLGEGASDMEAPSCSPPPESGAGCASTLESTVLASRPPPSSTVLASPLASTAASMDPSSPPPPPPSSTYDASPPDAHAASTLVTSTAEQKHRQKLRFNTALSYAVIAAGLPARSAIRCE